LNSGSRIDKGQVIKWTVYSLLSVNFAYYFFEESYIASHVLKNGGSFLDWTREFATTIDELGWFGLLITFELETYALTTEQLKKRLVKWSMHGVRVVCYIMLAHTVLARVTTVVDFNDVMLAEEVNDLCQVSDQNISYGVNYHYTIIDGTNCDQLSRDTQFFFLEETVITDTGGFDLERWNVWVDLNDALVWLLVVWAIELSVWLQSRNIAGGRLMAATYAAKVLYGVLFVHMTWWAYSGHWVWAWDQFLWIAGFWAIEKNLSEWREEIREEHEFA
jgi:hypothetical protein